MKNIYLDNNATTPVHEKVLEAMMPFFREAFGNPSSIHWAGSTVKKAVTTAREQVASLVNCSPSEVVFTSGGSESINTAIKGTAASRGKELSHCITTMVEHPAVFNSFQQLKRQGFGLSCLGVDRDGMLDLDELKSTITEQTMMISVMAANNETGVLFPVKEIGELAATRGISFIFDSVQAIGKIPLDFGTLPVDMLTVSGHKLHAPKGIGALIVRSGVRLPPLILGGPQENNRRAGTENVSGIVGLGKACEIARNDLDYEIVRIRNMRNALEQGIIERIPNVKINGHMDKRLPNTLNISFKEVYVESLLTDLNRIGIAVSAGSACSAESREVSRVLTALGLDSTTARSSIRFSLGRENSQEDIDTVIEVLPPIIEKIRNERQSQLAKRKN
ncbi:MAG: aminotransferase class V-fold PLP-dependent enzyme [Geobacteraceae bacterium]|nr:aminotransferase class V-fold PLP-dependent enzyme [Geobacteraceae bacterium]